MRPFILFAQVLALLLSWAGTCLAQDGFTYVKRTMVEQKDTVFENQLYLALSFKPEDGYPTVRRGPSRIFAAKGKLRVFQGAQLEVQLLRPEIVKEFQHALDALDIGRLPQTPDMGREKGYPTVSINYGEIHRRLSLTADADLARKIDALVEDFVRRIEKEPYCHWEPEQRAFEGDDQPARPVAFEELLVDPLRFHGKRVRVTGYYNKGLYTPDDGALCNFTEAEVNGEEDARSKGHKAAFWVPRTSSFLDKKHADSKALAGGRKVTMEGTFELGFRGTLEEFRGTIDRVTRITLAPEHPSKSR